MPYMLTAMFEKIQNWIIITNWVSIKYVPNLNLVIDPDTDEEGRKIAAATRLRSSKNTKSVESLARLNSAAASKPIISVQLREARLRSGKYKNGDSADAHNAPLLEKVNLINETQVQYRYESQFVMIL